MDDGSFHHWGDYLYYENAGDYEGRTLLIIPKDTTNRDLVETKYSLVQDLNDVSIYYSEHNPIDTLIPGLYGK